MTDALEVNMSHCLASKSKDLSNKESTALFAAVLAMPSTSAAASDVPQMAM